MDKDKLTKVGTTFMGRSIYIEGDAEDAVIFDEAMESLRKNAFERPEWYYRVLAKHLLGLDK